MDDAARRAEAMVKDTMLGLQGWDDLMQRIATALRELEAERDRERLLRLQLSDDSQRHLDRALKAEAAKHADCCVDREEHDALEAEQRQFYNLLAVIHRDGGHYCERHGSLKAGDDAQEIVCDLRRKCDALTARVARVEAALRKRCDDYRAVVTILLECDHGVCECRDRAQEDLVRFSRTPIIDALTPDATPEGT